MQAARKQSVKALLKSLQEENLRLKVGGAAAAYGGRQRWV